MRFEPVGYVDDACKEKLIHFHSPLNAQVAPLTQRRKVPIGTVSFASVEMMHCEDVAARNVMRMFATFAASPGSKLDAGSNLWPVRRVIFRRQPATHNQQPTTNRFLRP